MDPKEMFRRLAGLHHYPSLTESVNENVALKVGTIRDWDGVKMIKRPDGSWVEYEATKSSHLSAVPAPVAKPAKPLAPDQHSANGWKRLGLMRSSSDPSKEYVIGMRKLKDGGTQIGCDCPGWKYAKNQDGSNSKKPCKHIKAFLGGNAGPHFTATPTGVDYMKDNGLHYECVVDTGSETLAESISEDTLHWHTIEEAAKCPKCKKAKCDSECDCGCHDHGDDERRSSQGK